MGSRDEEGSGHQRVLNVIAPICMKKELIGYAFVSIVALAVDVSILYVATYRLGMPSYLAAILGYSSGLVVHYLLSVRYVFTHRRMGQRCRLEAMLYALTGIIGCAISSGTVFLGDLLEQPLIMSKFAAVIVSFVVIFVARKTLLFSMSPWPSSWKP